MGSDLFVDSWFARVAYELIPCLLFGCLICHHANSSAPAVMVISSVLPRLFKV